MSKVLTASCVGGVVTVQGVPVPGVILISEGVGQSEGILIVDEDRAYYVTNIGNDLDTTLEKLIAALGKLTEALTKATDGFSKAVAALTKIDTAGYIKTVTPGSGGAGGVPSPPVAASDISGITTASGQITTLVTDINAIKAELQTLKGSLQ